MPIVIGTTGVGVDANNARRLGVVLPVKEEQFYIGGPARENTEVDAIASECGAKRRAVTRSRASVRALTARRYRGIAGLDFILGNTNHGFTSQSA
jgi:hypothetical protein